MKIKTTVTKDGRPYNNALIYKWNPPEVRDFSDKEYYEQKRKRAFRTNEQGIHEGVDSTAWKGDNFLLIAESEDGKYIGMKEVVIKETWQTVEVKIELRERVSFKIEIHGSYEPIDKTNKKGEWRFKKLNTNTEVYLCPLVKECRELEPSLRFPFPMFYFKSNNGDIEIKDIIQGDYYVFVGIPGFSQLISKEYAEGDGIKISAFEEKIKGKEPIVLKFYTDNDPEHLGKFEATVENINFKIPKNDGQIESLDFAKPFLSQGKNG